MNSDILSEYLLLLAQESSKELLKIYFNKPDRKTLLCFPKYKNGITRISEQEQRFMFTNLHGQFPHPELFFSIETPTSKNYAFSQNAKGKRSASTDLSFYQGDNKVMNIEFKALNNSTQYSINKDIQKLTTENCHGAWVHLLKSENSGTIKTLFKKFEKAFKKFPTSQNPISFHILILESKTLLSRKGKKGESNYSENIFNINYELWKHLNDEHGSQLTNENNPVVDWQIDIFDI